MDYGKEIAKAGLEINAIKLNPNEPFQWASGWRMPIYDDNRLFLRFPIYRGLIRDGFTKLINDSKTYFSIIAGTSTAGISPATTLADHLNSPLVYVRDKPKDHGLKHQIEGIDAEYGFQGRNQILVIEDLISTGGSSARAVQAVRDAGGNCNHCYSIFNYGLDKAVDAFNSLDPKCEVKSLLTYDTLLEVAKETGYLNKSQIELLKEWREDPFGWGEKHGFPKVEK